MKRPAGRTIRAAVARSCELYFLAGRRNAEIRNLRKIHGKESLASAIIGEGSDTLLVAFRDVCVCRLRRRSKT